MTTIATPTPVVNTIVYDRETRDYALYLDGELVGFARTYHEGEVTLDQLERSVLEHGQFSASVLTLPAVYEVTDLAAAFRSDKQQAGLLLGRLTQPQLVRQALLYAAYLNELHGLALTAGDVLTNWQRGMQRYHRAQVAAGPLVA